MAVIIGIISTVVFDWFIVATADSSSRTTFWLASPVFTCWDSLSQNSQEMHDPIFATNVAPKIALTPEKTRRSVGLDAFASTSPSLAKLRLTCTKKQHVWWQCRKCTLWNFWRPCYSKLQMNVALAEMNKLLKFPNIKEKSFDNYKLLDTWLTSIDLVCNIGHFPENSSAIASDFSTWVPKTWCWQNGFPPCFQANWYHWNP